MMFSLPVTNTEQRSAHAHSKRHARHAWRGGGGGGVSYVDAHAAMYTSAPGVNRSPTVRTPQSFSWPKIVKCELDHNSRLTFVFVSIGLKKGISGKGGSEHFFPVVLVRVQHGFL